MRKRREFIKLTGLVATGALIAPSLTFCTTAPPANTSTDPADGDVNTSEFGLPELPYGYDALEPHIDARTMEIHHRKHHAGYTSKLNAAVAESAAFRGKGIEEMLEQLKDNDDHTAIRNNGGGYYNHSLYWQIMAPNAGGVPTGAIKDAINASFGSFESFKDEFSKAAGSVFGSGWAWLSVTGDKSLQITTTENQDNPLMSNIVEKPGTPVLGIDVWEHAYYLKHQNKRPDYIANFFNVINWDKVNEYFERAKS